MAGEPRSMDWESLARRLGSLTDDGLEHLDEEICNRLMVELVGIDVLLSAVEQCLQFRPGCEIAEMALRWSRPRECLDLCHGIALNDPDPDRRVQAVRLIVQMATPEIKSWAHELVKYPEFSNAIDIVFTLVHGGWNPEEAVEEFAYLETHPHEYVREKVALLRTFLDKMNGEAPETSS